MRVIAGAYRGKGLRSPEGLAVRPTGGKVREAVFDILGPSAVGAAFLDLFAGSGAVGIEALSRGAASCVFVEESPKALRALRANLESLRPEPSFRVLPFAASRALKVLREEGFRADVLFADPPYASRDWPILLPTIPAHGILAPGARVILEHATGSPPPFPPEWGEPRRYRYGGTSLAVYRTDREG